jgi:hypothetical protein
LLCRLASKHALLLCLLLPLLLLPLLLPLLPALPDFLLL